MIEFRLRTKISKRELEQKIGKILTDDDYNVLLHRDTKVLMPDGRPLCIYRKRAIPEEVLDVTYPTLHELRHLQTDNRKDASGMPKLIRGKTTVTPQAVSSGILGAFDPTPRYQYCRLTAWTGKEMEKYRGLWPMFQNIAEHFERDVPDRFANQAQLAAQTKPEWVIEGTPFTTITVNNTYATGVHTDKGDLDEGFSTLACLRKGDFSGGRLVFPEYRVAAEMGHGDLLLMDAHQYHGNTKLELRSEDAERISVVCYYRSKIARCGTAEEEAERARKNAERRTTGGKVEVGTG
jgi:hypothetical protein